MYDNYIAVDWAQSNMAIARLTPKNNFPSTVEGPARVDDLVAYLRNLRGKTVLTIEETTSTHWLYTELRDEVENIIICDPYRNKLLSEGAKNDRIDAIKLAELLRAGLLKEVFHGDDRFISARRLVSAYNDLVQKGVRLKNQRSSILRAQGKRKNEEIVSGPEKFIFDRTNSAIGEYESDKKLYDEEFKKISKASTMVRNLKGVPGIGLIGAIKLYALVITTNRFPHRNNFLSYSGLILQEKWSGGTLYGKRRPRCRREVKVVFKTAALAAISGDNCFAEEYQYLIQIKKYPEYKARHAVARSIATAVYGMMKNKGKKFDPELVRKEFKK